MILPRLLTCLTGLVALILAFYVYEEYIFLLGFPDSHVTDLGAAEKKLAVIFISLSVLLGLCLIGLSFVAGSSRKVRRILLIALVLYLLVLAGTMGVDHYFQSYLDNGIGG